MLEHKQRTMQANETILEEDEVSRSNSSMASTTKLVIPSLPTAAVDEKEVNNPFYLRYLR